MENNLEIDMKAKIFFYFRHGHFNYVVSTSKNGLMQFRGDNTLYLYEAISLILMNRLEEGIHQLEIMLIKNDLKLAATLALKYSHELIGNSTQAIFSKLDAQIKELDKSSNAYAFYYSAFVFMAFKQLEKALEYINKALTIQPDSSEFFALKGWILLEREQIFDDIHGIFEKSLQLNPNNLNAIIGISECFFKQKNFMESLNVVNKAVVQYTSSNLPLIQKLKIQFGMLDWDQSIKTATRILLNDSKNLYTRKLFIIILLCYSSNYEDALKEIIVFEEMLEAEESKNDVLILTSSQLFSKVCNKNQFILYETSKMIENVLQRCFENVEVLVEMGHQYLLRNQVKDASRY